MADKIKVWDFAIRLFHWSLVVSYTTCYWVSDDDVRLHTSVGYIVFGLVLFRIIWGFIGGRFARFSEFFRGPKTTLIYLHSLFLNKAPRYIGHNPAGGWMIIFLLLCLLVTSWTGFMIYAQEGKGPLVIYELRWLSGNDSPAIRQDIVGSNNNDGHVSINHDREDDTIYALHEFFSNLSLLLVLSHMAGVVVASRLHGENLTKAMITGLKPQRVK